jgi:hypothetical protein
VSRDDEEKIDLLIAHVIRRARGSLYPPSIDYLVTAGKIVLHNWHVPMPDDAWLALRIQAVLEMRGKGAS